MVVAEVGPVEEVEELRQALQVHRHPDPRCVQAAKPAIHLSPSVPVTGPIGDYQSRLRLSRLSPRQICPTELLDVSAVAAHDGDRAASQLGLRN